MGTIAAVPGPAANAVDSLRGDQIPVRPDQDRGGGSNVARLDREPSNPAPVFYPRPKKLRSERDVRARFDRIDLGRKQNRGVN